MITNLDTFYTVQRHSGVDATVCTTFEEAVMLYAQWLRESNDEDLPDHMYPCDIQTHHPHTLNAEIWEYHPLIRWGNKATTRYF